MAWVRRLGRRACIANGLVKLRRSPRVNGSKVRQETVSGPKGIGGGTSGVEQTDEDKTENGKRKRKIKEARRTVVTTENKQQANADRIVKQMRSRE